MLKGKEFGAAIGEAIQRKMDNESVHSKAEVARHFGVTPQAVSEWVRKGSFSKDKLPELWRFFADVAGPDHWGLTASEWPAGLPAGPDESHQEQHSPAARRLMRRIAELDADNVLSSRLVTAIECVLDLAPTHTTMGVPRKSTSAGKFVVPASGVKQPRKRSA